MSNEGRVTECYNPLPMDSLPLLRRGLEELGFSLTPRQLEQFEVYYHELMDWNSRMNLTAVKDYEGVQVRHFLDSLTAGPYLGEGTESLLDIGAGAGFPGVPLKIAFPQLKLTLVDSVGKKTGFLRHVVEELGLEDVEVHTGRAEDLACHPTARESFDVVVTRGVAVMQVLMELTLPFCRTGGMVMTWKKGDLEPEIAASLHAMEVLGGRLREVVVVNAEGLRDGRVIVLVDKVKASPAKYPRRPGLPQKRPL